MIPDDTEHVEQPRWKDAIWSVMLFLSRLMPGWFLSACVIEAWKRASLDGEWLFEPMSVDDLLGKLPPN